MSSPFSQSSADLAPLGFRVLPLIPHDVASHGGRGKAPGELSMGAWRGMSRWQRFRDSAPSKFEVDLWEKYPNANAGIVMGTPVGSDLHVVALDFDATDFDVLQTILRAAPASPMVKRGQKGETRLYVADKGFKTRSYDGPDGRILDVLTGFDTRQTVAPPSIHPATGKPYVWTAGPVPASQLPVLTEEDMQVLEETLETLGWTPAAARKVKRPGAAPWTPLPDSDDFFSETKIAALANLDAWVYDLDVYGLQPARGGYEAVATWRPSSTGQPIPSRKRNLSIQPNGIKDFGTNWTGSAIDLVMEAQGLDQAGATAWLRLRLGLTGDLIILDQQPRRVQESREIEHVSQTCTVSAFRPDTAPALQIPMAEQNQSLTVGVSIVRTPPDSTELPDHLTRVPGLVGEITEWICASAKRPQRGLSLGAAMTLVGTAAGRKVAGPTDSGTHLYVLAIAATGAGKDHPIKCIGRILTASTMKAHNGPSQFMSMSALINTLTHQPLTLSAMDEFGSFLKRVNGSKAGNHEQAISGIMRQVWGSSFGEIETPAYAQSQSRTLVSPAFSIFGASTAEEFYAAVEGDDVFNGFLNRFLTISTKLKPPEQTPTASIFEVPESISKGMVAIYSIGGPLMGATMHNGQSNAPAMIVPWDDEQAKHVYDTFGRALEAREEDAAFLSRTREMAVRLATIRALGISYMAPRITVADMEWGRDLALWSAERMMEDANDYMSVNEHQATAMRILRVIKARGRIKKGDLLRAMQNRLKAKDLADHLSSLVESEQILVESIRPEAGGTLVQWYSPN